MKIVAFLIFLSLSFSSYAQHPENLLIKGEYTPDDSVQLVVAYVKAHTAVELMHHAMDSIWTLKRNSDLSRKEQRQLKWQSDSLFMYWLGEPSRINVVHRRIMKMHSKFHKKFTLEVTKKNKGRCRGWISAWTLPYGPVKIRLCDDYFRYRTHLQEKVIVHELGHEVGMLFHRKIHGCWAARRAAASHKNHHAQRSPENYAWLAMAYIGKTCDY